MYITKFVGQIESECPTKKFGYNSKSHALAAIKRIKNRKQVDLVAYRCCCGLWHLTTKRRKNERQKRIGFIT